MNSFYIIRDSWGNVNIFLGVGIGEWDSGTVRQWGLGTGDSGMGNGGCPEEMVNGK